MGLRAAARLVGKAGGEKGPPSRKERCHRDSPLPALGLERRGARRGRLSRPGAALLPMAGRVCDCAAAEPGPHCSGASNVAVIVLDPGRAVGPFRIQVGVGVFASVRSLGRRLRRPGPGAAAVSDGGHRAGTSRSAHWQPCRSGAWTRVTRYRTSSGAALVAMVPPSSS